MTSQMNNALWREWFALSCIDPPSMWSTGSGWVDGQSGVIALPQITHTHTSSRTLHAAWYQFCKALDKGDARARKAADFLREHNFEHYMELMARRKKPRRT